MANANILSMIKLEVGRKNTHTNDNHATEYNKNEI